MWSVRVSIFAQLSVQSLNAPRRYRKGYRVYYLSSCTVQSRFELTFLAIRVLVKILIENINEFCPRYYQSLFAQNHSGKGEDYGAIGNSLG